MGCKSLNNVTFASYILWERQNLGLSVTDFVPSFCPFILSAHFVPSFCPFILSPHFVPSFWNWYWNWNWHWYWNAFFSCRLNALIRLGNVLKYSRIWPTQGERSVSSSSAIKKLINNWTFWRILVNFMWSHVPLWTNCNSSNPAYLLKSNCVPFFQRGDKQIKWHLPNCT